MSNSRQPTSPSDDESIIIRSLGMRMESRHVVPSHRHPWAQLIFASHGVLSVTTEASALTVPPQRAVWVPAETEHAIQSIGGSWLRTIYVNPTHADTLCDRCHVLSVSPLLRALVVEVVRLGMLRGQQSAQSSLAAVLLDQIRAAPAIDLALPWPTDSRARDLADRLRADPAGMRTLSVVTRMCGASQRTMERIFARETGLTLGRWRQQARLQHAIRRLGEGVPVNAVSDEVGYESPSAFIQMFRRALDMTPGQYQKSISEHESLQQ